MKAFLFRLRLRSSRRYPARHGGAWCAAARQGAAGRRGSFESALRAVLRDGAADHHGLAIITDSRGHASLRIDLAPSAENGLRAPSQVIVDWPQTVRFSDMGAAIGSLDAAAMRAIMRQMVVVLRIGSETSRSRRTRTR
jgi:hypothetical protein